VLRRCAQHEAGPLELTRRVARQRRERGLSRDGRSRCDQATTRGARGSAVGVARAAAPIDLRIPATRLAAGESDLLSDVNGHERLGRIEVHDRQLTLTAIAADW